MLSHELPPNAGTLPKDTVHKKLEASSIALQSFLPPVLLFVIDVVSVAVVFVVIVVVMVYVIRVARVLEEESVSIYYFTGNPREYFQSSSLSSQIQSHLLHPLDNHLLGPVFPKSSIVYDFIPCEYG
ncbi:hypothetical protein Tco_0951258 [Tanacetum coccineum]|uniref:Transmembrane protein n=1 Tax=Tanacetum coccineum TaxID=301880 RepID=A0ABQ5DVB7_9ASTR